MKSEHRSWDSLSRRGVLKSAAGVCAAAALGGLAQAADEKPSGEKAVTKGRIKQSVCAWCFNMPLEKLAQESAAMGLKAIDLVGPGDFATLKKHGLVCAITGSHGLSKGFNDKANHEECIASVKKAIDACADSGSCPTVICFSGNRNKISDDVGLANTVEGIKKVIGYAEEKKINLCIEILNSRHDHHDYQCDTVEWAADVCKQVGSKRMTMLFDIYHVQIMQGDIIARIRQYHEYIGHYHTAGVPGRNELDDNQELNYPAIMKAIVDTGYQGYVAQEFIPKRDPMTSLREAVRICDV